MSWSPQLRTLKLVSYGYGVIDKLSVYREVYRNFPVNDRANHSWDAGLTYLIKNNLQVDATIRTRFTRNQDLLLSADASYRMPN